MKTFEKEPERVVKEVKIFEESEFENGKDDGKCGLPVFGAEEAEECLSKQEKCEPPIEGRIEGVAYC